jgi:hypothetical protein
MDGQAVQHDGAASAVGLRAAKGALGYYGFVIATIGVLFGVFFLDGKVGPLEFAALMSVLLLVLCLATYWAYTGAKGEYLKAKAEGLEDWKARSRAEYKGVRHYKMKQDGSMGEEIFR